MDVENNVSPSPSGGSNVLAIVSLVITVLLVIAVGYLVFRSMTPPEIDISSQLEQTKGDILSEVDQKLSDQMMGIDEKFKEVDEKMETAQDVATDDSLIGSGVAPVMVVELFVKNTIDLSNTSPSTDVAKAQLNSALQQQMTSDSDFISKTFGIQDYPSSISYRTTSVSDDSATVRVTGSYDSSTSVMWDFNLIEGWLISEIQKVVK